MSELDSKRLTRLLQQLEHIADARSDADNRLVKVMWDVAQMIVEARAAERGGPLSLDDGMLERVGRPTRVTNSHEPAKGVNTQRGHDRLKGAHAAMRRVGKTEVAANYLAGAGPPTLGLIPIDDGEGDG